jgi:hypothetical protein
MTQKSAVLIYFAAEPRNNIKPMQQLWISLFMRSWNIFNIMPSCLFLKYPQFNLKSIGSLLSARINEFDVRSVCYLGSNDMLVATGIENVSDKGPKSVFGRNL